VQVHRHKARHNPGVWDAAPWCRLLQLAPRERKLLGRSVGVLLWLPTPHSCVGWLHGARWRQMALSLQRLVAAAATRELPWLLATARMRVARQATAAATAAAAIAQLQMSRQLRTRAAELGLHLHVAAAMAVMVATQVLAAVYPYYCHPVH
jgi:hypothetical protein